MSDLIILDRLATENKDVLCFPIDTNFKRANIGKNGWGEITIAVSNDFIANINNYVGALYLANKDQFREYKESEGE